MRPETGRPWRAQAGRGLREELQVRVPGSLSAGGLQGHLRVGPLRGRPGSQARAWKLSPALAVAAAVAFPFLPDRQAGTSMAVGGGGQVGGWDSYSNGAKNLRKGERKG